MMESLYPPGPAGVPADFAAPTAQYRRHAWLAMGALALFIVLYLGLGAWFAWKAWTLLAGAVKGGPRAFAGGALGLAAGFLAVFMLKGLFFFRRSRPERDLEVTRAQQPALFGFLDRLADEAGAPRPHRVFLSPHVNAAVFYDLSVLNLIFPSRKNLEIGLGLVNALSLGELKAVLAHEFGHFAQRTMAVGRWVYIAQQVADHIVGRRDALDRLLQALSNIDIRLAWIGWVLRLIVWSLRSLLEQLFRLVMLAQRALSREMELQADLVAVRLTGSDALIHALHHAQGADDAWDRAIAFVDRELARGHRTEDLFAVQSRMLEHLRALFGDEMYGRAPSVPAEGAERRRIFRAELAQPPRMWLTHPLNHEREANAKRTYLGASCDERSAWVLFEGVEALRRAVTASIMPTKSEAQPRPMAHTLESLDGEFAAEPLAPRYRGVYVGRGVTRGHASPTEMFDDSVQGTVAELDALYPESIAADLDRLRALRREVAMLESLRDGRATAPGGVIRHRDRELSRKQLPAAIAAVRDEQTAIEARVAEHDRRCRSVHRAAARRVGSGWDDYHAGVVTVLHYAEHSLANLRDAMGFVRNVHAVVTADGKVSSGERRRLVAAAGELYAPLRAVFEQAEHVVLDMEIRDRLGRQWRDALEPFRLNAPTSENLGSWFDVIGEWHELACGVLSRLRADALDQLLETESRIATALREGARLEDAPAPSVVPSGYATFRNGAERPLQSRLDWWSRFQVADGPVPAIARLLVAGGIVALVVGFGNTVGEADVTVYNGLATTVEVGVGSRRLTVPPFASETVGAPAGPVRVEASTGTGTTIESFDENIDLAFGSYVYNVAGAAPLVEWTALYGVAREEAPRELGAARWITTSAEYLFREPPASVSTKGRGARRKVLSGFGGRDPRDVSGLLPDPTQFAAVVRAHARWDDSSSARVLEWLNAASLQDGFAEIVAARLAEAPEDVVNLRAEQDAASGDDYARVCARHGARAAEVPDDARWHYLAARCEPDGEARDRMFAAGHERWPDEPWLADAAGFAAARRADWDAAAPALRTAFVRSIPLRAIVATDIARIERARAQRARIEIGDLVRGSDWLQLLLESEESGAYAQLQAGRFDEALASARSDEVDATAMLLLVGASEGAGPERVAAALAAAQPDALAVGTLGAAIGLALRERGDADALVPALSVFSDDDVASMRGFLERLRAKDAAGAETALGAGLRPVLRGQAYVAGVVALGDAAPARWRRDAKLLLFAPERPYFRDGG